jgi:MoxR-like ATPase
MSDVSPANQPRPAAAPMPSATLSRDDVSAIDDLRANYKKLRAELAKVIIGQDIVIERLLICILARGHGLLMGVPGLAKTTIVNSLAEAMSLGFNRIQFTPDLMPSDITGTDILQETDQPGRRAFVFIKGPLFANIILADEINRTPPKTQSALLEAMQEMACTVRGNNYKLPAPFFVLATQNPIELEGTYPLPEAQLDRFLFNTVLGYLSANEEMQVVDLTTTTHVAQADPVTTAEEILDFQQLVRMVPIGESVARYAIDLVRASRASDESAPDFVKKYVNYGASVRAAQFLVLAAKARALMKGRYHVTYEDIRALYIPVLRHRILLNFHAESDRLKQDDILQRLLEYRAAPKE